MRLLFLTLIGLVLFTSYDSLGQEVIFKLSVDKSQQAERDYQIMRVIDDRTQKSIGEIHDPQRNKHTASFGGKLAQQALDFYKGKVIPTQNPSYKLLVKIYSLDLKEIYLTDLRGYKGEIQLRLGFFLIDEDESVHLVDFSSKAQYGRPSHLMDNVQTSVQRLFENSWEYFDTWLSSQYQSNRLLAKKVRLNILDPKRLSSRDTVFYDPERPLTWDDFRDLPNPRSSFNATIFSSLSIEGSASISEGEIVQNIGVKVYMLPSQSWVKNANSYANNHEQRHFDLTRIAADRMITKLKNLDLKPKLFEATLNDIYLDAHREMNRLQELYDHQTRHGLDKEAQSNWNQAIRKALAGDMESLEKLLGQ